MKKITNIILVLGLIFIGAFSVVKAESVQFNVSLGSGSSQKAEIIKLQNFLINAGYLNASPIGIYGPLTTKAVSAFQKDNGVITTGYFGPLTRAVANSKLNSVAATPTINTVSVSNTNSNAAAVLLSKEKVVNWSTNGYPSDAGVNINLLRRTSNSPITYVFVRSIANNTPNDGQQKWVPNNDETGSDLYVEVVCSSTYQYKSGCKLSSQPIKVN